MTEMIRKIFPHMNNEVNVVGHHHNLFQKQHGVDFEEISECHADKGSGIG